MKQATGWAKSGPPAGGRPRFEGRMGMRPRKPHAGGMRREDKQMEQVQIAKKRWLRAERRKAKEEFRDLIREKRKELDSAWVEKSSISAQQKLLELGELREASSILCYMALAGEVKTDMILDYCRKNGKQLFVPAWNATFRRYEAVEYREGDKLVPGPLDIPQPAELRPIENPLALAIVPGMVFDITGARIGHGGGHYDRMFRNKLLAKAFKIGLCFQFQIFETAPANRHDAKVSAIVTEANVLRARRQQPKPPRQQRAGKPAVRPY